MSEADVTRPSLLLRLRDAHNQRAWEDFVRIYMPLIYGFSRRRGLQEADAADVAQEVLRTVAGTMQRFEYDPAKGRFRGWLLTVTRNKLHDFYDRQRRRPTTQADTSVVQQLEETASADDESVWDREYQRRLFEWAAEQVRSEVQPKTWDAFRLMALEGRNGEEVAEQLALSIGAVYVAKSRVTARLRHLIQSVGDDGPDLSDPEGPRAKAP